jgi:hypothetical protein
VDFANHAGLSSQHQPTAIHDLVPACYKGAPSYYVIHSWDGDFDGMVEALAARVSHTAGTQGIAYTLVQAA